MSEKVQQAISQTNFTTLDWGIVVCYLLISVVIGLWVKTLQPTGSAAKQRIDIDIEFVRHWVITNMAGNIHLICSSSDLI